MNALWPKAALLELTLTSKPPLWNVQSIAAYVCPRCRTRRSSRQQPNTLSIREYHERGLPGAKRLLSSVAQARLDEPAPDLYDDIEPQVNYQDLASPVLSRLGIIGQHGRGQMDEDFDVSVAGFYRHLRVGDASATVRAFFSNSADPNFIANLSAPIWIQFLRTLNPRHWLARLHRVHRLLNRGTQIHGIGFKFDSACSSYFDMLKIIISIRQEYGVPLNISDYRILLEYAGEKGNAKAAESLWNDMKKANISPDLDCYNFYMESKIFDEHNRNIRTRHHSQTAGPRERYRELASGIFGLFKRNRDLNKTVTSIFDEMSSRGITGDTRTFAALIFAMARDQDIERVNALLLRVWNIDVKALSENTEETPPLKEYHPTSPLAPTQRLLVALADAYGYTQNIATGLTVIDHISHHAGIQIQSNVWYQLLQWAYLDSTLRKDQYRESRQARLKIRGVSAIFKIMISPPYEIKPTMEIYHLLIKSLSLRRASDKMVKYMKEALRLFHEKHKPSSPRKRSALQMISQKHDHSLLLRWGRLALHHDHVNPLWWRRQLPKLILDWQHYMPSIINYTTPSGYIELVFRSRNTIQTNRARRVSPSHELLHQQIFDWDIQDADPELPVTEPNLSQFDELANEPIAKTSQNKGDFY